MDFVAAVTGLKRENPEADNIFYQKYFAVFRDALLGNSSLLTADMTVAESVRRIIEQHRNSMLHDACRRISADLEMVMYANRVPSRSFSNIDADAREIINAISE